MSIGTNITVLFCYPQSCKLYEHTGTDANGTVLAFVNRQTDDFTNSSHSKHDISVYFGFGRYDGFKRIRRSL